MDGGEGDRPTELLEVPDDDGGVDGGSYSDSVSGYVKVVSPSMIPTEHMT